MIGAGTAEYTVGGSAYWTNAQLQAALDDRRALIWEAELCWIPQTVVGGSVVYKRAEVPGLAGRLEAGTAPGTATNVGTVIDAQGSAVAGWSIATDGVVTFTNDQLGSARLLSAYSYDLYAAAADVLERWASHASREFDFETEDQSFKRSQKAQGLREAAVSFRARAGLTTIPIEQTDFAPSTRYARGRSGY
jgi:hypothetical protein